MLSTDPDLPGRPRPAAEGNMQSTRVDCLFPIARSNDKTLTLTVRILSYDPSRDMHPTIHSHLQPSHRLLFSHAGLQCQMRRALKS